MSLKDYWTQPPQAQNKMIVASQPKPSHLRPKGCKCKVADARDCYVEKQAREVSTQNNQRAAVRSIARRSGKSCDCACHYETGGFD